MPISSVLASWPGDGGGGTAFPNPFLRLPYEILLRGGARPLLSSACFAAGPVVSVRCRTYSSRFELLLNLDELDTEGHDKWFPPHSVSFVDIGLCSSAQSLAGFHVKQDVGPAAVARAWLWTAPILAPSRPSPPADPRTLQR